MPPPRLFHRFVIKFDEPASAALSDCELSMINRMLDLKKPEARGFSKFRTFQIARFDMRAKYYVILYHFPIEHVDRMLQNLEILREQNPPNLYEICRFRRVSMLDRI